ncbi:MAG: tetratricopeptide repeat protein, partial [Bacteroidaceae bacterium]|nr:tetratricopeptide repeat protein [Bacteroidaceae bacterium]
MKRFLALFIFSILCIFGLSAQNTKANGRKLFNEGRYEEAKPIFKILLKKSPKSAEYNYWYAACCYETKDTVQGLEDMLAFAEGRKVLNAPYYLGCLYSDSCNYPAAIDAFERFLNEAKDEERIASAKEKLTAVKELLRMMKSTERVCVVDSFIVDKATFLEAYHCGRDAGKFFMAADYFDDEAYKGVLTMTERGTDIYFQRTVPGDSVQLQKIFHSSKNGSEWSRAT